MKNFAGHWSNSPFFAIREDGAQAIVMGCTGFVDVAERIKHDLLAEGYDVPVLEAAQSALKLCEVYAKMGLGAEPIDVHDPTKTKVTGGKNNECAC